MRWSALSSVWTTNHLLLLLHYVFATSLQARPGSDVNLRNGRQQTPLLLAVDKRHVTIAKLLLDNGAEVNDQDDVGDSPLHVVVMYHSLKVGGSNTPKKEVGFDRGIVL